MEDQKEKQLCSYWYLLNADPWDCSTNFIWQHEGSRDLKIQGTFGFLLVLMPMRLACCWSFTLFDKFKRKLLLVVRHRGIMTMVCYESGQFREDFKFHMENWKSGSRGSGGEFHMKEAVISVGWYAISLLDDPQTSANLHKETELNSSAFKINVIKCFHSFNFTGLVMKTI